MCRTKEFGSLGLGKTSLRNRTLLGKWLWRFPKESGSLWHKVILSIYRTHSNGWDANIMVRWSHRCPWKAISQVFQDFSPYIPPCGREWKENLILGRFMVGRATFESAICKSL